MEICATEPIQNTEGNMSSTEAYQSSTKQDSVSSTDPDNESSTKLHASSTEKSTPAGCISGCRTDSSGPRHDLCCVFPFIYEGVTHSTCVEVDGNKSWCSTKVDIDGVFIDSEWGYCGDDCVFDTPLFTTDNQVSSSTEEVGYTSKPAYAVTEGTTSVVDKTSPTRTTTTSSPTTTVRQFQAVSSTSTTTAAPVPPDLQPHHPPPPLLGNFKLYPQHPQPQLNQQPPRPPRGLSGFPTCLCSRPSRVQTSCQSCPLHSRLLKFLLHIMIQSELFSGTWSENLLIVMKSNYYLSCYNINKRINTLKK